MPTKKTTKSKEPVVVEPPQPTNEDNEAVDPVLFRRAQAILARIREKTSAVVKAADEQWEPAVDPTTKDEATAPYLSDEEYDDVCNLTELFAETAFVRELGLFFDLPEEMVNTVVQARLHQHLAPAPTPRNTQMIHKKRGQR